MSGACVRSILYCKCIDFSLFFAFWCYRSLTICFVSEYYERWEINHVKGIGQSIYNVLKRSFSRVVPNVSGDIHSGEEVLEWLRKNRFRQPELNIFMYAVIALAITFVLYTAWLLSCFRPHMKQAWVWTLSWQVEWI